MIMQPRSDVHFFPFSEGAALFRQPTRQLTVLNQNAAVIWCLLNEVNTLDEAAFALQEKFPISKDKAMGDVEEAVKFFHDNDLLNESSDEMKLEEIPEDIILPSLSQEIKDVTVAPLAYKKVFRVPGRILEIRCQDKEIGVMLDEAMAHLAIDHGPVVEARLLVVPAEKETNCWDIFSNTTSVFTDVSTESVLPHLLQLVFDLSCKALSQYFLFHAAVISKVSKAVLFPANVGSGKTTLAAMLAKQGFQFFSDELAVIDVETMQVRPFTMPMSIKPGSLTVLAQEYPELETLANHFRPDGKVVRYLQPPTESLPETDSTATVSALVFPHYNEGDGNYFMSLSKEETLQRLVQTCSSDRSLRPQDIKAMLAMVEQSECMALYYEDTHEAIRLLEEQAFI
jgi:hypothetical protein